MKSALALLMVTVALLIQPAGVHGAGLPAGCSKQVPLYPGYPGYRGNVPGLIDQGDYACLEQLEALDSTFSKAMEDRSNQQAADALGILGDQEDWVWETWMAIDAYRHSQPACYSCLLLDPTAHSLGSPDEPNDTDPRVLAGSILRPVALTYLGVTSNGGALPSIYTNDYQLRLLAFLFGNVSHPTANELLAIYAQIVQGTGYPNGAAIVRQTIRRGGYVSVPPNTSLQDQYFIIQAAFVVADTFTPLPRLDNAEPAYWKNLYRMAFDRWQDALDTGALEANQSFADFMRQQFRDFP